MPARRGRLLKKTLVLIAPLLAVTALALVPISASGDTFSECPPGVTDHKYCEKYGEKVEKCVVPDVKGLSVDQAREELADHDCRVKRIRDHEGDENHRKGADGDDDVIRTTPSAGTRHQDNFRVTLVVD